MSMPDAEVMAPQTCTTNQALVRLRIDLGYDGTDFHGWAAQPGLRTVQQTLEDAIAFISGSAAQHTTDKQVANLPRAEVQHENQQPADQQSRYLPRLMVAGRTDAGVHSRGQVAHLDIASRLSERITARRLNAVLHRQLRSEASRASIAAPTSDVIVHNVSRAADGFDARFSAISRRYEYRLRPQGVPGDPLSARYTADVPRELSLRLMQQASDELVGLNDFAAFCKAREGSTSVRELVAFEWIEDDRGVFVARLEADAFCHSMVRALVGSVVAAGSGRISLSELVAIKDARERTSRFVVMPAHGLSLEEITYPPDSELSARAQQTRARRDPLT